MKLIQLFMLLLSLLTAEACTFLAQPKYQALPQRSSWGTHGQGYFEYQIDNRTYLIGYSNYLVPARAILDRDWYVRSLKWIEGAQDYTLYRAAEFTKSLGERFFVVLYKDDWHYTGYVKAQRRTPAHFKASPGAWVIIRIVDKNVADPLKDDSPVYSVNKLLESLAHENGGLPVTQETVSSPKHENQLVSRSFQRWRTSSSAYNSVPVPGIHHEGVFGHKYVEFKPDSQVTQTAPGRFTVAVWQEFLISPIHMLWQCIWHADREGYKVFKLENWAVEEHIGGKVANYPGKVWFRSSVDVVPQQQADPASLEPVFAVEEIRSRLSQAGAPLPY